MSFYVKRSSERHPDGVGWTGPIRSLTQAHKEAAAWISCGRTASVHPSAEVRKDVRAWDKANKARKAAQA